MSAERWRRAEQLFDDALEVETGARRAFVLARCPSDPELATEVLSMLDADRQLCGDSGFSVGAKAGGGAGDAAGAEPMDFLAKAVLGGQSLLSQADLEASAAGVPPDTSADPLDPLGSGAPSAPSPRDLAAEGREFGKYVLLEKIGAGGFGQVYRARDPVLGRDVAIKTCTSADPRLRQRFLREAKISAALQHPRIVTIFDFGYVEGVPYLVQELLPGEDLSRTIARREALPVDAAMATLLDVARGLAYAHGEGVLHRDVKPGNVRRLPGGEVKLLDFGIARLRDHKSGFTSEGVTLGTVGYLAPEHLSGRGEDERSDIFAFGILAYELLCFEKPFSGETFSQVSYQLLFESPPPLADRVDVPAGLVAVVERCLRKAPEERYRAFEDVIVDLESLRDGSELPPLAAGVVDSQPAPGRPRGLAGAVLGAIAAAALVAVWGLGMRREAPPRPEASPAVASLEPSAETVDRAGVPIREIAGAANSAISPAVGSEGSGEAAAVVGERATGDASAGPAAGADELRRPEPGGGGGSAGEPRAQAGAATPAAGATGAEMPVPSDPVAPRIGDDVQAAGSEALPGASGLSAGAGPQGDAGPRDAAGEPRVGGPPARVPAVDPATSSEGPASAEPVPDLSPAALPVAGDEVPPVLIERVEPDYPPLARRRRREATVVVLAFVGATGAVERTLVQHSSTLGLGFESAAVDAARRCRFEPGLRGGEPSGFWQELSFEFTLR
ncbi:MAG: TonB family protein [Acidobacteriota bacterium]